MTRLTIAIASSLAALVLTAAGGLVTLGPAHAQEGQGQGPSACSEIVIGQYISTVARTIGHSAEINPGNAQSSSPPFVPFFVGCNPTDQPGPTG